jgi:transaldolase
VTTAPNLSQLKVRVFADGADLDGILEMARNPMIRGFTTNPTLMRKAGIATYRDFARSVLTAVPDRPISFEVFSDEFDEMEDQAREIASWGPNVNVKIPITNTRGDYAGDVISRLSASGVQVNVTALMTLDQVEAVMGSLEGATPAYVSVFAGRIADTGRDPMPLMREAARRISQRSETALIWASPRELFNIFQADQIGCHVITVANDILRKLTLIGKDLSEFSLETVRMFRDDAVAAGYEISEPAPSPR